MPSVADFVSSVNRFAPPWLAVPGDPVGLQLGDRDAPVSRLMVSLDATLEGALHATRAGCDAWVLHHPLIYTPTNDLVQDHRVGRVVAHAQRHGLAVMAAHTNWDIAPGGVNDVLADLLELSDRVSFGMSVVEPVFKVVTFVPPDAADRVRSALASAGAGVVGEYSECAFQTPGEGVFTASASAQPAVGRNGFNRVAESRLEMRVPQSARSRVETALRQTHPYEEPAADWYQLAESAVHRMGRAGSLPRPMTPAEFRGWLETRLGRTVEFWCPPTRRCVRTVGVVGGGAGGDWHAAAGLGLDAFVSGEIRQHEAVGAGEDGMCVVAGGHYHTENPGIVRLGELVSADLGVELVVYEPEPGQGGRPR